MKCQKCAKSAVVHLTEIVTETGPGGTGETKRAVEVHLCIEHAVTAGLLTPVAGGTPEAVSLQPLSEKAGPIDAPAQPAASQSALAGGRGPSPEVCPVCGMNWNEFKQAGVMGCGHDYEQFAGKLLPLLKRAQEGAADHVGKVPARKKTPDADRQVTTLRLRRELQKALETENYEAAAQLRDKLRTLERN